MFYLKEIPNPDALPPYVCRCAELAATKDAKDRPCTVCCAWTADIVAAFDARADGLQLARAELDRLWTLDEVVLHDIEWPDEIDAALYALFAARQPNAEEYVPGRIYGYAGLLHRVAIARWSLTRAGVDWRQALLSALPLPWYIAQGRRRTWATVAEVIACPVLPEDDVRNREWTREAILYGLLGRDYGMESTRFRIITPELQELIHAINEGSFNDLFAELMASCQIQLVVDNNDYYEPLRVGFISLNDAPAIVFMLTGKHLAYSRVGVLDVPAVTQWVQEALGPLLRFAPASLLRERPQPHETHLDWIDPCDGTVELSTLFCPRELLPHDHVRAPEPDATEAAT